MGNCAHLGISQKMRQLGCEAEHKITSRFAYPPIPTCMSMRLLPGVFTQHTQLACEAGSGGELPGRAARERCRARNRGGRRLAPDRARRPGGKGAHHGPRHLCDARVGDDVGRVVGDLADCKETRGCIVEDHSSLYAVKFRIAKHAQVPAMQPAPVWGDPCPYDNNMAKANACPVQSGSN
jgi:hypothetical protein